MSIRIVTDSTANLTPETTGPLNITVVPLNVRFGTETFKAGVDLTSRQFFDRLRNTDELPVTSLPSPADFQDVYARLTDEGHTVISIHLSSKLSGTFGSARTAAAEFGDRVTPVDTGHVSSSLFLLVLGAARMAAAGATRKAILQWLEETAGRARVFFIVDTLEYLKRSGRVGEAGHLFGSLIDLKPILTLKDGIIAACAKVRTRRKAFDRAMEFIEGLPAPPVEAVVCHAAAPDRGAAFSERLRARFPEITVHESTIGSVVGTSSGPGCIAVGVM